MRETKNIYVKDKQEIEQYKKRKKRRYKENRLIYLVDTNINYYQHKITIDINSNKNKEYS